MANPNPPEANRFKPDVSGNPNGRPSKGYSITETIREMMTEKPEIKRALGSKILEAALKGDLQAIKLMWNYMDGMPEQKTDISFSEPPIPILTKQNALPGDNSTSENTEPNKTD